MDPHSFLGNGQFKILAFLTFRLCCDKMVSELAQYSMDNPAGVQPFQPLMIIEFNFHEFEIVFKYWRQIKHTQNVKSLLFLNI